MAAELQHITYNEYLPNVLGSEIMEMFLLTDKTSFQYQYLKDILPSTTNVFATAAFRFGHSQIPTKQGTCWNESNLHEQRIETTFRNPSLLPRFTCGGINRWMLNTPAPESDR